MGAEPGESSHSSASPLPNSDWQLDTHLTDGEGDNAYDKEKISPPRYVFLLVMWNVEFTHYKSSPDNWKWQWAVSARVLGCQRSDVNFFDMFLSG